MIKTIINFSLYNLLIAIILFMANYYFILESPIVDGNTSHKWMQIFKVFLNLGFSAIFLFSMIATSLTILLNLISKVRNNFYLSLLSYIGIATYCFILAILDINLSYFILFTTIYLLVVIIEFLAFRRRIKIKKV